MQGEPVTELSNDLSKNIDVSAPYEITSILHKCDMEIFEGWHGYTSLNSVNITNKMMKVASHIQAVIKEPSSGVVVMSGCGTSGRLAFIAVRRFNKYLKSQGKEECFKYIIAGEDQALFYFQELAEDDPLTGAECLKEAVKGKSRVVYIGISCGLSSVFVAGQLDLCLSNLKRFTPVIIGFNPAKLARDLPVQNWNKTFLTIIKSLEEAEKSNLGFILNPIVGPEPITGSSRMKSGTATRIILECLALTAIHGFTVSRISQLIQSYKETCEIVYRNKESLSKLIQMGGDSLRKNGHIYYLGSDGCGLMAMVDASECPPTFSASSDDIRGFVSGGYEALSNSDGNLSRLGPHYRISFEDFDTIVVPYIQENDLMVVIGKDVFQEVYHSIKSTSCQKVFIGFDRSGLFTEFSETFNLVLNLDLGVPSITSLSPDHAKEVMNNLLQEMALKWVLNNLSTGAHILKGKVFGNRMVDVKVGNHKLYYRAISIVQKLAKCSVSEAEESLLKSIYGQDDVSTEIKDKLLVDHIKLGTECNQVVPSAILIASLQCTVQEARHMIRFEPVISKLLTESTK